MVVREVLYQACLALGITSTSTLAPRTIHIGAIKLGGLDFRAALSGVSIHFRARQWPICRRPITTRQEQYSRDRVTTNILENRTSRSPDSNFYRYSLSRLRSPCACGISLEVSGNLGASYMLERTLKLGYGTLQGYRRSTGKST